MNPTRERMEGTFERTLTVTGPVSIDVSVHAGLIRVLRGEAGSVRVRGVVRTRSTFFLWGQVSGRMRRIEENPPIAQDGNAIGIGDVTDRWLLRGLNLLVEIIVPADTEVRALADSGDIRIDGIDGPVECETDSGQIEIANIGSEVRASSDSGSIHIEGVRGPVDARSDSGRIEALEVEGTIDATADSGTILLSQTKVAPVCAKTDSGRIRAKLADGGGYTVRARTDSGRIEMPQLTRQRMSRHELEGDVRGGGSVVDLETDSGGIEVVSE
jgi:Putative adhesin